ncbi:hypothetical protein LA76x_0034 [Lysobacter antibioticus]|uniref:Uncharacterized protein n=1 Tax=Lysobacter antibioticus TaxID=84531 RepID=A0A0S2F3S3_LYSAN|nr:hypothetical protein LA76x_0034 [Lysobacter antibioticus]
MEEKNWRKRTVGTAWPSTGPIARALAHSHRLMASGELQG